DHIGRKPLLISTVTGNCLCYLSLAFAPNFFIAFVVRLLGGVMSGNSAVVQGYIADVTPPEKRAGRMAIMGAAFNVGFIVGPSLGGLLARPELGIVGFRPPLLVACALSAMSAAGIALFVRESRAKAHPTAKRPNRFALLGIAVKHPVVGRLMLLTFLAGCGFTGIEATFALWGQHRFGWTPRNVGLIFGFVGLTAAFSQSFLTGRLSRRYGEAKMLAAGMGLTVLAASMQPFSTGLPMSAALMALMAFGQSVAFPNVAALITRAVEANNRGGFLGLNNASGAAARVAGPISAGVVFSAISVNAPFVQSAIITIPAIFLALAAGKAAHLARADVASRAGLP
ncbi:MAG: MFS transporter, partial [Caulobacteraceae bacterium]